MFDHLLLGCSDLDQGIVFVESHTGVRPAIGGVHPGRGTRNALLSLGQLHYLEVIAPDPAQTTTPTTRAELPVMLKRLTSPTLVDWAVHTSDIVGVADRPDGKMLHWQTLNLDNDREGLLPFFIQWGADTVHPSADAPAGCKLESFAVVSPESALLSSEFQKLGIDVQVASGSSARLRVVIAGPKGKFNLD